MSIVDMPRSFTVATLAARWGCNPGAIYGMINRGELGFFRLGEKLIRIPAAAVAAYEGQANNNV